MQKANSSKTPPSQEALWRDIHERFVDFQVAIFGTRFETAEQAVGTPTVNEVGKTILKNNYPSWIDPEAGPVRPWLLIPFDEDRNISQWDELRDWAEILSEDVEIMLSQRVLGPEFILAWGMFFEIGGLFEDAWSSEERISRSKIGAAIQSILPQQIWFSKVYRGGSVCLSSSEPFRKWLFRSVMPRPGLVAA